MRGANETLRLRDPADPPEPMRRARSLAPGARGRDGQEFRRRSATTESPCSRRGLARRWPAVQSAAGQRPGIVGNGMQNDIGIDRRGSSERALLNQVGQYVPRHVARSSPILPDSAHLIMRADDGLTRRSRHDRRSKRARSRGGNARAARHSLGVVVSLTGAQRGGATLADRGRRACFVRCLRDRARARFAAP